MPALLWFALPVIAGGILVFLLVSGWPGSLHKKYGNSGTPVISADGRFVVFVSEDAHLVDGDDANAEACGGNNCADVFVKNLATGEIVIASTDSQGVQGDGDSGGDPSLPNAGGDWAQPVISGDGRYVIFGSEAASFTTGSEKHRTLFFKDMTTGALEPVLPRGETGWLSLTYPGVSADGRHVAFWSKEKLTGDDTDTLIDVYVKNLETEELERVSLGSQGTQRESLSTQPKDAPAVSADGVFIAFSLDQTNPFRNQNRDEVGNRDRDLLWDIFVRNTVSDNLSIVSSPGNNEPGNDNSFDVSISGDGRYLAFSSWATNLAGGFVCGSSARSCTNVYWKDMKTNEIKLVSRHLSGESMDNAGEPVISADGQTVAFVSVEDPVISEEEGTILYVSRVYLWDQGSDETTPLLEPDDGMNHEEASPSVSGDGRYIAFVADATLFNEDRQCQRLQSGGGFLGFRDSTPAMSCRDVYLKDRETGEISIVSKGPRE